MSPKRPRQLLVALHVLTSVGWLTMALAQVALITHGITTTDPQTRRAALTMTEFVDHEILQQAATGSAYTGLMLSALTSWGFFRFTWVAVKFGITIGGLYLGIWHLGSWLEQGVRASETGWGGAGRVLRLLGGRPHRRDGVRDLAVGRETVGADVAAPARLAHPVHPETPGT